MKFTNCENYIKDAINSGKFTSVYVDSGDFGKIMESEVDVIRNNSYVDVMVEKWHIIVYCSKTPTKMSKTIRNIYEKYDDMWNIGIFYDEDGELCAFEKYLKERIFRYNNKNIIGMFVRRIRFSDDV